MEEDNDWVLVKKQKVTVLIPPPSPVQLKSGTQEVTANVKKSKVTRNLGSQKKKWHEKTQQGHKTKHQEEPFAMPFLKNCADNKNPVVPYNKETGNSGLEEFQTSHSSPIASLQRLPDVMPCPTHNAGSNLFLGIGRNTLNGKTEDDDYSYGYSSGHKGVLPGAANLVSLQMRAINLEKELEKLGGLRRWLASQGLDRYVTAFEKEAMGKYQLATLTSNKLKDMGIVAVGPRRKLIHAISHLSEPYL